MVKVSSMEGAEYDLDIEIAIQSRLIANMIEDVGFSQNVIPLNSVAANVLELIIDFCHKYLQDPVDSDDPIDIPLWQVNYCTENDHLIFDILLAANFLDVRHLFDLCTKYLGSKLVGKSPEALLSILGVEMGFLPEEQQQVIDKNEWAPDT